LEVTVAEIDARPNTQRRELYPELKHVIETCSVSVQIGLYALMAGTKRFCEKDKVAYILVSY